MLVHHLSRKNYERVSSHSDNTYKNQASASRDTYSARFKTMIAPITQFGSFATLAALHLPIAAIGARTAFENIRGDEQLDTSFAGACLKGLVFGLTVPVALGLATAFLLATLGAYAVCVPYSALHSLPGFGAKDEIFADSH